MFSYEFWKKIDTQIVHISPIAFGSALDFFKNGADNYCY